MQRRTLGQGLEVSAVGLGCMSMSGTYGDFDDAESKRTLARALELGIDFFDTADVYGPFANEAFVGHGLAKVRDRVVIATKFGFVRDQTGRQYGISGKPDYIRHSCDLSLQRLGTDHIDLYYQHRLDPDTPIEETVAALGELVQAGKIRHIGLCEVSADTLRRAHAVHPITALQSEYSLWTRDVEDQILPACRELGIGFVPYSPLGRGLLTGAISKVDDLASDDWRRTSPRFQGEAFDANLRLVEAVRAIAEEAGCTPAQLALAWVLAQGSDIVPIPGTKRQKYLEQNVAALDVALSAAQLKRLEEAVPRGAAAGERYADMSAVDR